MPCDTIPRQRAKQIVREKQVKTLEKELKAKKAKLVKTPLGIRVEGWSERGDWCDECVVRRLTISADWEIRHLVEHAQSAAVSMTVGPHTHAH